VTHPILQKLILFFFFYKTLLSKVIPSIRRRRHKYFQFCLLRFNNRLGQIFPIHFLSQLIIFAKDIRNFNNLINHPINLQSLQQIILTSIQRCHFVILMFPIMHIVIIISHPLLSCRRVHTIIFTLQLHTTLLVTQQLLFRHMT